MSTVVNIDCNNCSAALAYILRSNGGVLRVRPGTPTHDILLPELSPKLPKGFDRNGLRIVLISEQLMRHLGQQHTNAILMHERGREVLCCNEEPDPEVILNSAFIADDYAAKRIGQACLEQALIGLFTFYRESCAPLLNGGHIAELQQELNARLAYLNGELAADSVIDIDPSEEVEDLYERLMRQDNDEM